MNTNRMSCGEVREKLPLYVGGDLDPDVLEAVRGHLDLCGECARRTARAMGARQDLVAAFRARAADVAQPGLWSGIHAALQAEGLIQSRPDASAQPDALAQPVARARRPRWSWALAPLAAAAVLLLLTQIAGLFGGGSSGTTPRGPRATPAPEIADTAVSRPVGGTLERIDPDYKGLPPPFAGARPDGSRAPAVGGASLAGYKRIK